MRTGSCYPFVKKNNTSMYFYGGVHLSRRKDTVSINKYGFGKSLHTRMKQLTETVFIYGNRIFTTRQMNTTHKE